VFNVLLEKLADTPRFWRRARGKANPSAA
jgi:hypothetical protein